MKKKICIICPSLQMGGIERSLTTIANYLNSQGEEVHFITIFPFENFFSLDKGVFLYEPKINFLSKDESKIFNMIYYVKMLSPIKGKIVEKINLINPDIVLSYGDWFPHLIMLGLRNKYPFIYSNRSNPNIRYSKFKELVRFLAYKFTPPSGVIAQTTQAKERKERILGKKIPIKVIPNPVSDFESTPIDKNDWIVSVGRLHKEKGFIRLIEAFSNIKNKYWKLVLVGDGIHKKQIEDFVKEKKIQDRVIFTGKIKNVNSILLQSKIFVLASHNEGFPNALLEASALGLACISFDIVAGPSDIITNGENGILLDDGDISGLTFSIDDLIANEDIRLLLGNNAIESSKRFKIENIGKEIHLFLNDIFFLWKDNL